MTTFNLHHVSFPLEPSQLASGTVYRRGEATGMVFCPRRRAEIAIMRCGEYQQRDGCAKGCANAVPAAALQNLRGEMVKDNGATIGPRETYRGGAHDHGKCVDCGLRPAVYVESGQCHSCYWRERGARQKAAPSCSRCGKKKRSNTGVLCTHCAAELRNESGRRRRAGL